MSQTAGAPVEAARSAFCGGRDDGPLDGQERAGADAASRRGGSRGACATGGGASPWPSRTRAEATRSPADEAGTSAPRRRRRRPGPPAGGARARPPRRGRRSGARRPSRRPRCRPPESRPAIAARSSGIAVRTRAGGSLSRGHSRSPGTTRQRGRGPPRPASAAGRARAPPSRRRRTSGAWTCGRSRARRRGGRPGERARALSTRRRRRAGSSAAGAPSAPGRPVSEASASRISFRRHVAVAEDVSLAGSPLLRRREVARRDVAHVDEVQSRVDVSGHLPVQEVDDQLPRRRRLDVELADRRRRVDDDDRQAPSPPSSSATRSASYLRLLVVADDLRRARPGVVSSAGEPSAVRPSAADRARVDDPRDPGLRGGARGRSPVPPALAR